MERRAPDRGIALTFCLLTVLGQMTLVTGNVATRGSVAYVSQQAWIQSTSLRSNILFGRSLDAEVYEQVLDVCSLTRDLEILPGGERSSSSSSSLSFLPRPLFFFGCPLLVSVLNPFSLSLDVFCLYVSLVSPLSFVAVDLSYLP